ncbi:MAG: hypothetical protein SR1Q7_03165 [Quinella sp. 1Q7]|nr:hypothetical protein [Quinella sp. 1Q7]
MATRDENLKKIDAELEAMSDDELSMVAGGTKTETANDSRFLNSLNGSCDRYGESKIVASEMFDPCSGSDQSILGSIRKGWQTVGITAHCYADSSKNTYNLNGNLITQQQAREHAMKVTGHYMTEKDWNW